MDSVSPYGEYNKATPIYNWRVEQPTNERQIHYTFEPAN